MSELEIETERVLLRPLLVGDADAYHELESNSEVQQFVGGARTGARDDIERTIAKLTGDIFDPLAVVEKSSDRFIGRCGFIRNANINEVEIHIVLAKNMWGRGLATEVGEALLSHGFDFLGLQKIVAILDPENHASKRICEKLGMKFDGEVSSDDHIDGHWIYSIEKMHNLDGLD